MLINVIPGFMWKLELLSKPLLITAQIPMWTQSSFKLSGNKKIC